MGCKQSRATDERLQTAATEILQSVGLIDNKQSGASHNASPSTNSEVVPVAEDAAGQTLAGGGLTTGTGAAHETLPSAPAATVALSNVAEQITLEGMESAVVQSVYDGDTLTLTDGRRVRLLGIDAPEIKTSEPYSTESRDFVRSLCNKNSTIYLQADGTDVDKYGRLLRYVYVHDNKKSIVQVNKEVLRNGLGRYYAPGGSLSKSNELLLAAKEARTKRLGIWTNFDSDKKVYVTRTGLAFHEKSCSHIASSNVIEVTIGQAVDEGKSACRTCSTAE